MGFQHDIDRVIEPLQQARDEEDENRRAELLDEALAKLKPLVGKRRRFMKNDPRARLGQLRPTRGRSRPTLTGSRWGREHDPDGRQKSTQPNESKMTHAVKRTWDDGRALRG